MFPHLLAVGLVANLAATGAVPVVPSPFGPLPAVPSDGVPGGTRTVVVGIAHSHLGPIPAPLLPQSMLKPDSEFNIFIVVNVSPGLTSQAGSSTF